MQSIESLLSKVATRIARHRQIGAAPEVVGLTSEDEETWRNHEWMKSGVGNAPPDIRRTETRFAGLEVEWDAPETLVRVRTDEEKRKAQARQEAAAREAHQRAEEISRGVNGRRR